MIFDLVEDFADLLDALPEAHPRRPTIETIHEALRRDVRFLHEHPCSLFQYIWNLIWWHDAPQAEGHYATFRGEASSTKAPRFLRSFLSKFAPHPSGGERISDRSLYEIANSWRRSRIQNDLSRPWIRSLRPPTMNLRSPVQAVLRGHEAETTSVAWSGDGRWLASGSHDRTVRIWDVVTGAEASCLRGHQDAVTCVAWFADGRRIASASRDSTIRVWDAISGDELRLLRGHEYSVNAVAVSASHDRIVSGSSDRSVRIWSFDDGMEIMKFDAGSDVFSVAVSRDGACIVSGQFDGTARVRNWNRMLGRWASWMLRGHTNAVQAVAIERDCTLFATASLDGSIRIWPFGRDVPSQVLSGHDHVVRSVAFSRDGTRLVSGSNDRTVRVWNPRTGEEVARIKNGERAVNGVDFSADGKRVACASGTFGGYQDDSIKILDLDPRRVARQLLGHQGFVVRLAFSPDGRRLATGGGYGDRSICIWQVESGQLLRRFAELDGDIRSLSWSANGAHLSSGSNDGAVRIWNPATGVELRRYEGFVAAYSPDGRRIASASRGRVTLRKSNSRTPYLEFDAVAGGPGWGDGVSCLAWSCDGDRLAIGSGAGAVKVQSARTGIEVAELRGCRKEATAVAFSPDGFRVAAQSSDGTIHVWNVMNGACIDVIVGSGDVAAVAAGFEKFPMRALAYEDETIVDRAETGTAVAWSDERLSHLVTHPTGRIWAAGAGSYVCLFQIEGAP